MGCSASAAFQYPPPIIKTDIRFIDQNRSTDDCLAVTNHVFVTTNALCIAWTTDRPTERSMQPSIRAAGTFHPGTSNLAGKAMKRRAQARWLSCCNAFNIKWENLTRTMAVLDDYQPSRPQVYQYATACASNGFRGLYSPSSSSQHWFAWLNSATQVCSAFVFHQHRPKPSRPIPPSCIAVLCHFSSLYLPSC